MSKNTLNECLIKMEENVCTFFVSQKYITTKKRAHFFSVLLIQLPSLVNPLLPISKQIFRKKDLNKRFRAESEIKKRRSENDLIF